MTNQGRVFAAGLSLSILVGPGFLAPAAGEPLSLLSSSEPTDGFAPDGAVPPAVPACELPLDSLGERRVNTESSARSEPASDAPIEAAAIIDDGWAEAYAAGSRVSFATITAQAYPVELNSQVQFFLDLFTGARRDIVTLWVNRSARYLSMARETFRERGLPEELAFTAMIESGFKPDAVSRVGAKGMWQFMAATARRYGLRVDRYVDERLDPQKSTVAAAHYLRDLHDIFGSWALAQAAYNAGEVKVARAIRLTGSRDFWTLAQSRYLRRETKDFVPQIHAATMIGRDPERYGFDFGDRDPVAVDTISVPPSTDLRRLSAKRSEERRVGKECRARWAPEHEKKS